MKSNSNNKISKGIEMNDKDYITSFLTMLKDMEKNYTVALTEASNEELFEKYFSMFEKIAKLQRNTFELMNELGWYQLEEEEISKIVKKYDSLKTKYEDLGL